MFLVPVLILSPLLPVEPQIQDAVESAKDSEIGDVVSFVHLSFLILVQRV